MPTAICANGHEVSYRNTRGARIADMRCGEPGCGQPLHGKGKGAIKRGRCSVCNRRCEFTVPDVGERVLLYRDRAYLREAVPGEHLCRYHSYELQVRCGCAVTACRGEEVGRICPPILFGPDVQPCRVHGARKPGTGELVPPAFVRVTIRDRASEPPWGVGRHCVALATVEIPNECLTCGGPRGETQNLNQYDDGIHYSVDVWENPCGHIDAYEAVMAAVAGGRGSVVSKKVL